jgi:hypothetical protein
MKFPSRRLLVRIFFVLLVIVICGVVTLSFIIRSPWFLKQARAKLEQSIGRKVTFSSIKPSLLFGVGVRVSDFSVYEEDGETHFLDARRILLKVRILPLLWRVLSVSTIQVDHPQLNLFRKEGGDWNFKSLIKKRGPVAERPARAAPPERRVKPRVVISRFRMNGGLLTASDPSWQKDLVLDDLSLEAQGITPESLPNLSLSARFFGGRLRAEGKVLDIDREPRFDISFSGKALPWDQLRLFDLPRLSLDGEVDGEGWVRGRGDDMEIGMVMDLGGSGLAYGTFMKKPVGTSASVRFAGHLEDTHVRWDNSTVTLGKVKLETSGSLEFAGDRPLKAAVRQDNIDCADLAQLIDVPVTMKGEGKIDLLLELSLKRPAKTWALSGQIGVTNGLLQFHALKNELRYDAVCDCSGKTFQLGMSTVRLGSTVGEGNAIFSLEAGPHFECDLNFPHMDVADFVPPPAAGKKTSRVNFFSIVTEADAAPADPPAGEPFLTPFAKEVSGTGRISIGELRLGKLKSLDARARFSLAEGVAKIDEVHLPLYGGEGKMNLTTDLRGEEADCTAKAEISELDIAALLSDIYGYRDAISGRLFADFGASGRGRDWPSIRKSLGAAGRFAVKDGVVRSFGLLKEMGPMIVLLGQGAKSKELVALGQLFSKAPDETRLSRCEGGFQYTGDRWGTGDMLVEIADVANPLRLKVKGTVSVKGELELNGRASFPRGTACYTQLAPYFPDEDGWIEVPFPIPIGGTLARPRIDMEAARGSIVNCAADIVKLRLRKEIEKKIDRTLAPGSKKEGEKPGMEDVGRELLRGTSKELLKRLTR